MTSPWAIVASDFVKTGGMDRANYALAAYLARLGNPVELVSFRVGEELAAMPNVRVHLVGKPLGSYTLGFPALARRGRAVARDVTDAGGRVVVNGGNCPHSDVNWVHYVHAAFRPVSGGNLARRWLTSTRYRRFLREERAAFDVARVLVADSNVTRDHLIGLCGVPPDRVRTVYYGSDPALFHPPDTSAAKAELRRELELPTSRPIALFVGAMSDRRKGFDTVFSAWPEVNKVTRGQLILLVIGSGAEVPKWQALASQAGWGESMRFLGHRRDVPRIMQAADLLLSPTRYEAYGLAVHEAICCAVPAIVSRGAGVAERFPADLADLLIDNPNDAAELARRTASWWKNPDRCTAAAGAFGAMLRQWSWDDMSREIVRVSER